MQQYLRQLGRSHAVVRLPCCWYKSHHHASIARTDFISESVRRQFYIIVLQLVRSPHRRLQYRQHVVRHHRHAGGNQCRKACIQRNHIACAMLVWPRLTDLARQTQQTVYRIKHGLLNNYLRQQLKKPSVKMRFA
uniref:hypothetical protein n=1 Tax=Noviherbaspirillum aerium TaxID=2588497 RepID=UPI00178C1CE7|nr:hypothetical protein [Noviherbaspirillum aerium]